MILLRRSTGELPRDILNLSTYRHLQRAWVLRPNQRSQFAASRDRRRIISEWLKARDAEGEVAKIAAPDVPAGTRLGPRMRAKR